MPIIVTVSMICGSSTMPAAVRCARWRGPMTLASLVERFAYAFNGRDGYPPTVAAEELPDRIEIGDIAVTVVDQPHGIDHLGRAACSRRWTVSGRLDIPQISTS